MNSILGACRRPWQHHISALKKEVHVLSTPSPSILKGFQQFSQSCRITAQSRRWTAEENNRLVELRAQGASHEDISKQLDRTCHSIESRLTYMRSVEPILQLRRPKSWSDEETEQLLRMKEEGSSNPEISIALNKSLSSIEAHLYNVLKHAGRFKPALRPPLTPDEGALIVTLRRQGRTYTQIQSHLSSRSTGTISCWYRNFLEIEAAAEDGGAKNRANGTRYSPEEDAKLLDMRREQGLDWSAIRDELKRTSHSIKARYGRLVAPIARKRRPRYKDVALSEEELNSMRRMREAGETWTDIHRMIGKKSKLALFNNYADYEDGRGLRRSSGRRFQQSEDDIIRTMKAKGETSRAIAGALEGRTVSSVRGRANTLESLSRAKGPPGVS